METGTGMLTETLTGQETGMLAFTAETAAIMKTTVQLIETVLFQTTEQFTATVRQTAVTITEEEISEVQELMEATEAATLCTDSLSKTLTKTAIITGQRHPGTYSVVLAEIQIQALLTEAAVHIQIAEAPILAADHPALHTPAVLVQGAETIQAEAVTVAAVTQEALLPEDKSEV